MNVIYDNLKTNVLGFVVHDGQSFGETVEHVVRVQHFIDVAERPDFFPHSVLGNDERHQPRLVL